MPSQAVPAPAPPAPDPEPVADSGFVTFGQPAPAPPTDALVPPAPPAPEPVDGHPRARRRSRGARARRRGGARQGVRDLRRAAALAAADERARADAAARRGRGARAGPAGARAGRLHAACAGARRRPGPSRPRPVADTMMPSSLPTTPPKPPKEKAPAGESGDRPKWIIPAAIGGGVAVVGVVGGARPRWRRRRRGRAADPRRRCRPGGPAVELASRGIALTVSGRLVGRRRGAAGPRPRRRRTSAGGPKGGAVVFGKADDTAANSTLLAGDLRQAAGDPLPEKTIVDIGDGAQAVALREARHRRRQDGDGLRRADRRPASRRSPAPPTRRPATRSRPR